MISITKVSPEWGDSFILEAIKNFAAKLKENPEFVNTLDVPGDEFQKIADHVLAETALSPFQKESAEQMESFRKDLRSDLKITDAQPEEEELELTNEFIDALEEEILSDIEKEDNGAL